MYVTNWLKIDRETNRVEYYNDATEDMQWACCLYGVERYFEIPYDAKWIQIEFTNNLMEDMLIQHPNSYELFSSDPIFPILSSAVALKSWVPGTYNYKSNVDMMRSITDCTAIPIYWCAYYITD